MGLIVVTWNVLHRIHAVNWREPVIAAWPDERSRIGSIADWIAGCDADVICLQEVSGDQLAMLREVERGELFAFRLARVPAPRVHAPATLRDPAEYLVTIVRAAGARQLGATTYPTDDGKGLLRIVLADGTTVIDTHVSYGDKRPAQLAQLAAEVHAAPGPAIVCGDFNADRATCVADLGPGFTAAVPPAASLPTRPRAPPSEKSQDIDHVIVRGGRAAAAMVLDGEGRSDHNPVRAAVFVDDRRETGE